MEKINTCWFNHSFIAISDSFEHGVPNGSRTTLSSFIPVVLSPQVQQQEPAAMLSLDEPLDLKLHSGRTHGPVRLGKRACPSSICAPLSTTRPRLLCSTFPSPPSSPGENYWVVLCKNTRTFGGEACTPGFYFIKSQEKPSDRRPECLL